jgi:outer membrane protein OmpA-like peptidoglycan-associated protein
MNQPVTQGWLPAIRFSLALVAATVSLAAPAQTVMVYQEGQTPSAQDVADILSRGASENMQLRGQVPAKAGGSPFAALEQKPTTQVGKASALSVPVTFGFDSALLTPQARVQLNTIAEGIRMTEGTLQVVIEGHTDAKGRLDYNDALSLRRASAVREYLVHTKGLPVKLLVVDGKGPRKPIDPNPYSPRNRRVQFRAG